MAHPRGLTSPGGKKLNNSVGRILHRDEQAACERWAVHLPGHPEPISIKADNLELQFTSYVIAPSPDKGTGVFAKRNILRGEIIVIESPILKASEKEKNIQRIVNEELSAADGTAFRAMFANQRWPEFIIDRE